MTTKNLTGLFTVAYMVFGFATNAQAIELLSYKDTDTGLTTYTKETVTKAWSANQPACIKNGAKLLGVNKAFRAARLGYRDCSKSAKRAKVHKALGIKVTVFGLSELPADMIKQIMSK